MNDILYKNAYYFKNEILPYTFILETKGGLILIKNEEQDFAHLVGKQHSQNTNISRMKAKDFLHKVLSTEITYNDLINFDITKFKKHYQWIKNKNIFFEPLFNSFFLQKYKFIFI